MVRRYEARSDDLPVLRGRLDVARQVRRHFARRDLLACQFDEFSEDNALNQVLKVALVTLLGSVRTAANERSISDLLLCFQDVADVPTPRLRWHHASVDRLTSRYRPLLQLAKLFIEGRAPDVVSGRGHGFALLFDMNELFEKYVGRIVKRMATGSPVGISLQGPSVFLARREGAGQAFKLIPDIVAHEDGRVKWIADTKWKRLDASRNRDGLSSADMYQMHAYARRYRADDVVLIYPHHAELGPWKAHRDRYLLAAEGVEQRVAVATVDLRDLRSVPAQLKEILEGLIRLR